MWISSWCSFISKMDKPGLCQCLITFSVLMLCEPRRIYNSRTFKIGGGQNYKQTRNTQNITGNVFIGDDEQFMRELFSNLPPGASVSISTSIHTGSPDTSSSTTKVHIPGHSTKVYKSRSAADVGLAGKSAALAGNKSYSSKIYLPMQSNTGQINEPFQIYRPSNPASRMNKGGESNSVPWYLSRMLEEQQQSSLTSSQIPVNPVRNIKNMPYLSSKVNNHYQNPTAINENQVETSTVLTSTSGYTLQGYNGPSDWRSSITNIHIPHRSSKTSIDPPGWSTSITDILRPEHSSKIRKGPPDRSSATSHRSIPWRARKTYNGNSGKFFSTNQNRSPQGTRNNNHSYRAKATYPTHRKDPFSSSPKGMIPVSTFSSNGKQNKTYPGRWSKPIPLLQNQLGSNGKLNFTFWSSNLGNTSSNNIVKVNNGLIPRELFTNLPPGAHVRISASSHVLPQRRTTFNLNQPGYMSSVKLINSPYGRQQTVPSTDRRNRYLPQPKSSVRPGDVCENTLCENEKYLLLKEHNRIRRSTVPSASNMKRIIWDIELEKSAQIYAKRCIWKHDRRRSAQSSYSYVGQNMNAKRGMRNVLSGTTRWEKEQVNYNIYTGSCDPGKLCGHYTQMVWANTETVGCALWKCPYIHRLGWRDTFLLVCNYGPGGNMGGEKPYKIGNKCTACDQSYPRCNDGLCI